MICHPGVVELNHFFEGRETSVVHVRPREFDVSQGWNFKQSFVPHQAGKSADTFVHVRIFQPVVVDGIARNEIVGSMTGGAGCVTHLAEEELASPIFLDSEIGESHRDATIIFCSRGNNGTDELREGAGDTIGSDLRCSKC